jgi:hypothetical protein
MKTAAARSRGSAPSATMADDLDLVHGIAAIGRELNVSARVAEHMILIGALEGIAFKFPNSRIWSARRSTLRKRVETLEAGEPVDA